MLWQIWGRVSQLPVRSAQPQCPPVKLQYCAASLQAKPAKPPQVCLASGFFVTCLQASTLASQLHSPLVSQQLNSSLMPKQGSLMSALPLAPPPLGLLVGVLQAVMAKAKRRAIVLIVVSGVEVARALYRVRATRNYLKPRAHMGRLRRTRWDEGLQG